MLCKYPVPVKDSSQLRPCGQCFTCTVNKRRVWSHRIVLESMAHSSNAFLTLTYDDDNLPGEYFHHKTGEVFAPFSVSKYHHQDFMKRLGYYFGNCPRFYMCGEYGEKSQRPHYHYALFGFPRCHGGAKYVGRKFIPCECSTCLKLKKTWGKGNIFLGTLTPDSASYVCGYINKKLTNSSDFRQSGYTGLTNAQKLNGRHPEFGLMSLKPGLASYVSDNIVSRLTHYGLLDYDDVPRVASHGAKSFPLGRYISDKVHEKLNHSLSKTQKDSRSAWSLFSMLRGETVPVLAQKALLESPWLSMKLLNSQRVLDIDSKAKKFRKDYAL